MFTSDNQTLRSLSWLIRNRFIAVSSVYGIFVSAAVCWQHEGVNLVDICTVSRILDLDFIV